MKKVNQLLSSVRSKMSNRKCAAVFSASVFALSSITCVAQVAPRENKKNFPSAITGQKIILELSESYLSPNADNSISVLEIPNNFFTSGGSESESIVLSERSSWDSEKEEPSSAEETTAKFEPTTKAPETTTAPVTKSETTAPETTQAPVQEVNLQAGGAYTFAQLGITQMSDIPVPDDILFDENGIPLNYSYKLSGKATAYNMGTTTATGTSVHPGVVAVNPNIIPYGSKMYIVASDGSGYVYGYASAEDTGGFIYWDNAPIVDMYVNSYSDACYWGNRPVTVYVF